MKPHNKDLGIVVIGRNEGERLHKCLLSLSGQENTIVYVDSGSTDGSVKMAQSLLAQVVELDLSIPFTAARARNVGFEHLLKINPHIKYVQFVDGDCEIVPGWLELARKELDNHPNRAVICGRLRERFPERSIYNLLCDLEWRGTLGEIKACGGLAMMRVEAFQQVNGFNPQLIAGEEPELCVRLRQKGWKIWRINGDMALHDAEITQFNQWWRRNIRGGHAYAEGAWLHGKPPEYHWVKESLSIKLWGGLLPLMIAILAWFTRGWSLILLFCYPLLAYRIYQGKKSENCNDKEAFLYGLFVVLGKFPQFQGQLSFYLSRFFGKRVALIEYKSINQSVSNQEN
ncbi:MAG: glycosyltransferase [Crocosphaera sp.]|nr:glycosyltransferase [Crocosphaera sp.]